MLSTFKNRAFLTPRLHRIVPLPHAERHPSYPADTQGVRRQRHAHATSGDNRGPAKRAEKPDNQTRKEQGYGGRRQQRPEARRGRGRGRPGRRRQGQRGRILREVQARDRRVGSAGRDPQGGDRQARPADRRHPGQGGQRRRAESRAREGRGRRRRHRDGHRMSGSNPGGITDSG